MAVKLSRAWRKFLTSDEHVLFAEHHHWTTWGWLEPVRAIIYLVIAVVTYEGVPAYVDRIPHVNSAVDSLLGYFTEGPVYMTVYFVVLGIFASKTINEWRILHSTVYLVTDERVICASRSSMFRRESWSTPLTQIKQVDVIQTLKERLLGYGTLKFRTSDSESTTAPKPTEWVAVPHPFRAQRLVAEAMTLGLRPASP